MSKLSSSLKFPRALRYSSFGSGPTTGAQNSNPSARQAPSSFVPMPAVSTSFARAIRESGLIGKSEARNRASSSTHWAAKSASAPDASLTGAAAAASSAGVPGLTAAGAATAASSDGRLSGYDGAATLASTVGVDACGSDSKYDALSLATRALSIVAVLALTARCDIWERYEFSKALAPMASAKITRCMVDICSGTRMVNYVQRNGTKP